MGLTVTAAVLILWLLGAFDFPDAKLLDLACELRGPRPAPSHMVIVAIDEASIASGRRNPLPRDYLADLIERVAAGKPRAIMLDVLLDQPLSETQDAILAAALAHAGNVLLPAVIQPSDTGGRARVLKPLPMFADAALAVGHVGLMASAADGVVRRFFAGPREHAPPALPRVSFAALGAAAMSDARDVELSAAAEYDFLDPIIIDFAGPANTWYHIPARDLESEEVSSLLAGRLVIIGSTLPESGDFFIGPFVGPNGSRTISGVEVQANCVATLMDGTAVRLLGSVPTLIVMFVFGILTSLVLSRTSPAWSLAYVAGLSLFLLALVPLLFAGANVYVQGAGIVAVVIAVGGFFAATGYIQEAARAAAIRGAFSRYLAPSVVDAIAGSGEMPQLGGHASRVAVLFCDMRDFSKLSRKLSPEELVEMLSTFFESMCAPILRHGGFVDKLVGDQVMALFGVPCEQPDDVRRAASAALQMREALLEFNRLAAARGWPTVRIGIGVHCGQAVVGNVGWEDRMDYTAMGETVVLAARLQDLCKKFETDILVSSSVREELGPEISSTLAGYAVPHGWSEELAVYELRHANGE